MAHKNVKNISESPLPDNKKRATIYLSTTKIKSIKYIAFTDETTQTEIIDEALTAYITQWEKTNGTIPKK